MKEWHRNFYELFNGVSIIAGMRELYNAFNGMYCTFDDVDLRLAQHLL